MTNPNRVLASQIVTRICLLLFGAIAIFGGILQMTLGEPETTPRLDNIHRFMAGVYLGTGFICAWCAWTIRQQRALPYLIAVGGLLAAFGRMISMNVVGTPEPAGLWIGYLASEIIVPAAMIISQRLTDRKS